MQKYHKFMKKNNLPIFFFFQKHDKCNILYIRNLFAVNLLIKEFNKVELFNLHYFYFLDIN